MSPSAFFHNSTVTFNAREWRSIRFLWNIVGRVSIKSRIFLSIFSGLSRCGLGRLCSGVIGWLSNFFGGMFIGSVAVEADLTGRVGIVARCAGFNKGLLLLEIPPGLSLCRGSTIASPAPSKVSLLADKCPGFISITERLGWARGLWGSPCTMIGSQWPDLSWWNLIPTNILALQLHQIDEIW